MLKITLEQLIEGMIETNPLPDYSLPTAGLYDPENENSQISYNPDMIVDKEDLYITIIHELMHYYDFDNYLPHEDFDYYAGLILEVHPEYREIIDTYINRD